MSTTAQKPEFKPQYDNFIGGKFVPPVKGEYFDNISPIVEKYLRKRPDQPRKM